MRKRISFRKLGMDGEHRWAMLRNMVTSLIHHERIMTTTPRAKELRRVAEQMVTHAKIGNLHHRRLASGVVRERSAVVKLFEILGPRYKDRPGGYTRVMKLGLARRGDSADMAMIEFVDREGEMRKARQAPGSIASLIYGLNKVELAEKAAKLVEDEKPI
jgi:large subunit ribosomal protein L17